MAVAADEADSTAMVAVAEVAEADEGAAMILIMAGSMVWTAMILTVNFPCLTITRLELLAKRSFMRSARKAVTVLLTRSTLVRKLPTTRTLSRMKGLHLLEMKRVDRLDRGLAKVRIRSKDTDLWNIAPGISFNPLGRGVNI